MHKSQKKALQFLVPMILAAAVTWITLHPFFEVSYRTPFLLYFGAIFISAAIGGSRSSIIATLSCVIFSFLFILPGYRPSAEIFGVATFIFMGEGLLVSGLFRRIERIQQKLAESEQRFRGIIEKSAEGTVMTDQDGKIGYVSPSFTKFLIDVTDNLDGKQIQSLIHPEQAEEFQDQLNKLINHEIAEMAFIVQVMAKEGRWIWIEGVAMDHLEEKSIRSIVFQCRDVTSRIELEMQKEDFLQITSHELKTPITSIKGFIQVLKKKHVNEGRTQDITIIDRIENQSGRLEHLIEDLLDVTRVKNGELPYRFSIIDLTECITEVISAYQAIHPDYTFVFLPLGSVKVYADKDRIGQVLTNLLNNAIKYSPTVDRLEISVSREGAQIKTSVKDYGIGIPVAYRQQIFERFYRIPALPKEAFNGLGIGLYISNEIIKKHGGMMGVESEELKGSEFWFKLNMAQPVD